MKKLTKEMKARIERMDSYDLEHYQYDYKRLVKALKEGRLLVSVISVATSGMSRTLRVFELSKSKGRNKYYFANFYLLFKAHDFNFVKSTNDIRVYGCGMDMVFATLYEILDNKDQSLANNYQMV